MYVMYYGFQSNTKARDYLKKLYDELSAKSAKFQRLLIVSLIPFFKIGTFSSLITFDLICGE